MDNDQSIDSKKNNQSPLLFHLFLLHQDMFHYSYPFLVANDFIGSRLL